MGRRVDMYSPEQQQPSQLMAPRMSFSCDFSMEPPPLLSGPPRASTVDADFEFSVGGGPMMAADQLFSKGRILPLREAAGAGGRPVTLRDELHAHGGTNSDRRRRADRPSSGSRWKELLGLRKAHRKGAAESAGEAASADNHVDLGDHGETGA